MSDHWTNPDPGGQESRLAPLRASLEPVRRTRVHEEVAARLRRLIADGHLKPGDKLPPERQLAAMLGVSRTSVRDGIRTLEVAGLLEPRQGEGTVVRELSHEHLVAPLASALLAQRDLLADLLAVRKMIEPTMARQAALHATPEEIHQMETILERQAIRMAAGEVTIEEDTAFHDMIARAARNRVVLRILDVLMDLLREGRERSLQGRGRPQRSLRGHRKVLEAICQRNGEGAAHAMLHHLEEIEEILLADRQPVGAGAARGV